MMKFLRVRLIMAIARALRVPIQVHQTFFVKGMRPKIAS